MATRPEARKISGDEERVLHFEWHAAHFESADKFLPPLPESTNVVLGMPTPEFHSATLRFAMLRKFIMAKEPVRMDLVAKSMKTLAVGDQPNLVANLDNLVKTFKDLTKSPIRVTIGGSNVEPDAIYENIVNGLIVHSDLERRDMFDTLPLGVIHGDALHQRNLRRMVLSMLATIEEGRSQGYLAIGAPYRRIWEPKPRESS